MRARSLCAALAAGVLSAGLWAASPRPAQGEAPPAERPDHLGDDPAELALYDLLHGGRRIEARAAAEALLRDRGDSYAALYVLGYVLHRAEGNLPLARRHLEAARRGFESRHGIPPWGDAPWRWHLWSLEELIDLADEMEDHREQLALLDAHDRAYNRDRLAERAWPLMRLYRFEQARAAARAAIATQDEDEVSVALTALCAIEAEAGNRQEAHARCADARSQEGIAVADYTNAAGAAFNNFRPDEAEQILLEIEDRLLDDDKAWRRASGTTANPWSDLTQLYLEEGRLTEARDTAAAMLVWRDAQPPELDQQTREDVRFVSALLLLAVGRATEATRTTATAVNQPDRTGYQSVEPARQRAATLLVDAVAHRVAGERLAEAAAWLSGRERWEAQFDAWRLRWRAWTSRRGARALLTSRTLANSFRPLLGGGLLIPSWMYPDLVSAVGPGIAAVALARARTAETSPAAAPFLIAVEAEIQRQLGHPTQALGLASAALASLPKWALPLRARVAAIGGAAALDAGQVARAAQLLDVALQLDRSAVRAQDVALPAAVQASGGEVAQDAAAILRRSPRLHEAPDGFTVRVDDAAGAVSACLLGPSEDVIACAEVKRRQSEPALDTARRLAAEFHEQAFAPRVDLTQADVTSLDGSPLAAGNARYVFDGLLDLVSGGN